MRACLERRGEKTLREQKQQIEELIDFFKQHRGALGALLVYDITKPLTFDHIPRWLEELRLQVDPAAVVMLVGNKCDLKALRALPTEARRGLAEKEGLLFLETSALDATNVERAFHIVLERIYRQVSRSSLGGGSGGCKEETPPLVIKSGTKLDVKES